jgi:carbon monoxide dehydrogenase subunit G
MPSTISSASEFRVNSDPERCWEFFTSLQNIGSCIPGCESVTLLDENTALFKVKVSVGYISKTFELKARLKDMVPGSKASFVGEGRDAAVEGTIAIRSEGQSGGTNLGYSLQIRPLSPMGRAAMGMFGGDLVKKQAESFASCVKAKLERADV